MNITGIIDKSMLNKSNKTYELRVVKGLEYERPIYRLIRKLKAIPKFIKTVKLIILKIKIIYYGKR